MNISKYSRVTQALLHLHWLPVCARIDFKILILVLRLFMDLHHHILVIFLRPEPSYNLRSNSSLLLRLPKEKMRSTLHARSLDNCFGFIDGTVQPITRPGENQRVVYNGHEGPCPKVPFHCFTKWFNWKHVRSSG